MNINELFPFDDCPNVAPHEHEACKVFADHDCPDRLVGVCYICGVEFKFDPRNDRFAVSV